MRSERFDTPGPLRLDLRVPGGRVQIECADTAVTEVELEPLSGEASEAAVERARIELRGDELFVKVPDERGFGFRFMRRLEVGLRVRCPHGCDAAVKTRSADVEGRGRFRAAAVNTTSGDVEFGEVEGDAAFETLSGDLRLGPVGGRLTVNTVSGDATVERAGGDLRVQSVSGDLNVREATGPVTGTTISGDLELVSVEGGDVELDSVSGDLRVGIRRGSRLAVDATAVSGDLESEIELSDDSAAGEEEGPIVELRARTISGDLRVVRA